VINIHSSQHDYARALSSYSAVNQKRSVA